jgi:hypothetical protein
VSSRSWRFTENPEDPCALCVIWVDPEGIGPDEYVDPDDMIPRLPSGIAECVYRGIHDECQASVDAYMAERDT